MELRGKKIQSKDRWKNEKEKPRHSFDAKTIVYYARQPHCRVHRKPRSDNTELDEISGPQTMKMTKLNSTERIGEDWKKKNAQKENPTNHVTNV